jgi:Ras-related protein Rab-1A
MDDYDYIYKIILIGDSSVGKTSVLLRFADNTYMENYKSTIGVDFKTRNIIIPNEKDKEKIENIKLQIWDTGGQERFRTIATAYYRRTNAVILMFDLTDPESLVNIEKWFTEISKFATSDPVIFLVGNKTDLKRKISKEQAQKFADDNHVIYTETSAKNDDGVGELFQLITKTINSQEILEEINYRSPFYMHKFKAAKPIKLEKGTKIKYGCCS